MDNKKRKKRGFTLFELYAISFLALFFPMWIAIELRLSPWYAVLGAIAILATVHLIRRIIKTEKTDIYIGKRRTITVTDEGISTNRKQVAWDEILGVQRFTEPILRQLFHNLPMVILLLKGGRSIWINRFIRIEGIDLVQYNDSYKSYFPHFFTLLEHIERNAPRINALSGWFSWRAWVPIFILQPPIMIGSYLFHWHRNLDIDIFRSAHTTVLLASVLLAVIGLVWEWRARKKYWI